MTRDKISEDYFYWTELRDELLDEFYENRDYLVSPDSERSIHQTDRWKEFREAHIGEDCVWCGKEKAEAERLHLHHNNWQPIDEPKKRWNKIAKSSFHIAVNRELYPEIGDKEWDELDRSEILKLRRRPRPFQTPNRIDICPSCESTSLNSRKTKEPEWRCNDCKKEFDEPDQRRSRRKRVKRTADDRRAYNVAFTLWLNHWAESVTEEWKEEVEENWEAYWDPDTVVTICQMCHYQHEKQGNVPCRECNENYHSPKWETCVECNPDTELCPECDENWYNKEKNDACRDCREPYYR